MWPREGVERVGCGWDCKIGVDWIVFIYICFRGFVNEPLSGLDNQILEFACVVTD